MDAHVSLEYCGQDKLISSVQKTWWWPGLGRDAMDYVRQCVTCQWDSPPKPPEEELRFLDKVTAPLLGWALDSAGNFKENEEGNQYLLVAIDPFSKWVEVKSLLHSWRTAKFLYDICSPWDKPSYIRTNNGTEYWGFFKKLCKGFAITHH